MRHHILCILLTLVSLPAFAQRAPQVIDLSVPGGFQRILLLQPEQPKASLVFLPGADGNLGITDSGAMPTLAGGCAPLSRTREAFVARDFTLAMVDRATDGSVQRPENVQAVVDFVRRRTAVPVWVIGGSASTERVVLAARAMPAELPGGAIVFSPWGEGFASITPLRRPVLVLDHAKDVQSTAHSQMLMKALAGTPGLEHVTLNGGSGGEKCGGPHLFFGVEAAFVDAVSQFALRDRRR